MMYKWLTLYKIAVELIRKVNASRTFRSADCLSYSTADSACPRSVNPNSSLSWACGSFFAPNFNGFTLLSRQHSGESFMSLSRKTDGRHSNGRNSSPSPHKSFLRQMIPFQVDNRPTSQLSFSPLTVSVRCHSQRGEMWQTWQWDNILQPKGGALLGSVTHFHDSFISPSCRKMPDYHSCSLDSCFCIITSSFKLKPVRSTFVYVKLHSRGQLWLSWWRRLQISNRRVGYSNSNCPHTQVSLSETLKFTQIAPNGGTLHGGSHPLVYAYRWKGGHFKKP